MCPAGDLPPTQPLPGCQATTPKDFAQIGERSVKSRQAGGSFKLPDHSCHKKEAQAKHLTGEGPMQSLPPGAGARARTMTSKSPSGLRLDRSPPQWVSFKPTESNQCVS